MTLPGPGYFDWNATAPLRPEAAAAMIAAMGAPGNASSVHRFGRSAKAALEAARQAVAGAVGAGADRVVFTGSATEANNWALAALLPGAPRLVSAVEHDSVLAARPDAQRVPVDRDGRLDLAALQRLLAAAGGPVLLACMLANNETGAIQPVAEAAALVHAAGGAVHCDAVQALGKLPVDFAALGVDTLSLSAHKIGGPAGIGALVLRPGLALDPFIRGGGQERRQRAGTENLLGAIGFGAAAAAVPAMLDAQPRLAGLRDGIEAAVRAEDPQAVVFAAGAPRLANTACLAAPGLPAQTALMALDLAGFAVSSGSACSSGKVTPSHVLAAMGVPPALSACALRFSLGPETSAEAAEALAAALCAQIARRRSHGAQGPRPQASIAAAPANGL